MQKCIKPAKENDPTSHLIYYVSNLATNDFIVLIASFKSSSIQHGVNFVKYASFYFKIDNKAGHALGRGYLVSDRSPPWRAGLSCSAVRFMDEAQKDTSESASSKYVMF